MAQDDAEAVAWFRKAAAQGHADAQYNLGVMYANGKGVPQDFAEAIAWYRKAAVQGHTAAPFNLAVMYTTGEGVPQDFAEAAAWYGKAAAQGDAKAQYNLGVLYYQGRGVPQDDTEAVAWFRKSVAQNHAPAQFNLGVMYYQGRGVPQDDAEAVAWFRKAAAQGHASAQDTLESLGVPQDDVAAQRRIPPPPRMPEIPKTPDTALSDLSLGDNTRGRRTTFTLTPPFQAQVESYTATIANDRPRIRLSAEGPNGASIEVTGETADGTPITPRSSTIIRSLNGNRSDAEVTFEVPVGRNILTVEVTSGDGSATQTYTVTVERLGE